MKAIYSRTIEKPAGWLFARWSAGAKAYELTLPPEKRVVTDPLAHYYAGEIGMKIVALFLQVNPSIRMAIVLRARYFDDCARQSLLEGYEQVVLLGAGYDSRFLRLEEFRAIRVFELDLESTQVIKKCLTRRMLGRLPEHVTYVPIDFSRESLRDKLIGAGFDRTRRTLFIWEAVSLFLNEEIVIATLERLAELGGGNRVLFDFVPPELIDDATDYNGNRQLLEICALVKEPLTYGCRPHRMRAILKRIGYRDIRIVSLREAHRMYCGNDQIEDSYFFASTEVAPQVASFDGDNTRSPNNGRIYVPTESDIRAVRAAG
ncbi:MAG TPA: SAM-dependent methyltransferase [Candidatus Deferrimicrobium sp.]|nr:SAM-dependent methyltransferase [Candidatus Deferrimicrobium sp.]